MGEIACLLDTLTLLWWWSSPERLSALGAERIWD